MCALLPWQHCRTRTVICRRRRPIIAEHCKHTQLSYATTDAASCVEVSATDQHQSDFDISVVISAWRALLTWHVSMTVTRPPHNVMTDSQRAHANDSTGNWFDTSPYLDQNSLRIHNTRHLVWSNRIIANRRFCDALESPTLKTWAYKFALFSYASKVKRFLQPRDLHFHAVALSQTQLIARPLQTRGYVSHCLTKRIVEQSYGTTYMYIGWVGTALQ